MAFFGTKSTLMLLIALQVSGAVVLAQLVTTTWSANDSLSTRAEPSTSASSGFATFTPYPDVTVVVTSSAFLPQGSTTPIPMDSARINEATVEAITSSSALSSEVSSTESASAGVSSSSEGSSTEASSSTPHGPSPTIKDRYALPNEIRQINPCIKTCLEANQFWSVTNCWETNMTNACVCLDAPLAALSHIAKCVSRSCDDQPQTLTGSGVAARSAGASITAAPSLPEDPMVLDSMVAEATTIYNSYCHAQFAQGRIGVAVEDEMTRTGALPDSTRLLTADGFVATVTSTVSKIVTPLSGTFTCGNGETGTLVVGDSSNGAAPQFDLVDG